MPGKHSPENIGKMLTEFAGILSALKIPYMLIGGLAVDFWGRPRSTLDLDFSILANEPDVRMLLGEAEKQGYVENKQWGVLYPIVRKLQLKLVKNNINIDVLFQRDKHDVSSVMRRKRRKIGGSWLYIVSPDDLIIQKLKVGRPRDFEDAISVLIRSRKQINTSYLRSWAEKIGIKEELEYILERE